MADDAAINSLKRFRKDPGNLVLEHFSHCEVPAGCGGVVVRWRNPYQFRPVKISAYTPIEATWTLDGAPLSMAWGDVTLGKHVVAVQIENIVAQGPIVMFSLAHQVNSSSSSHPKNLLEKDLIINSEEDGTWRYSLDPLTDSSWQKLAYDDSNWPALVEYPAPKTDWNHYGAVQLYHAQRQGAKCLGVPWAVSKFSKWFGTGGSKDAPRTICIRKVIEIPQLLDSPSDSFPTEET